MKAENVCIVKIGGTFSCQGRLAGDQVGLVRAVIDVHTDCVKAAEREKLSD